MNTKKLFGGDKKFVQKLFVAFILHYANMIVNERCERVHLINLLEEEGNCNNCDYCEFINRLRNALKEKLFFTSNVHIKNWDVQFKNNKLKVEPVGCSFCFIDGIIQNQNAERRIQ